MLSPRARVMVGAATTVIWLGLGASLVASDQPWLAAVCVAAGTYRGWRAWVMWRDEDEDEEPA